MKNTINCEICGKEIGWYDNKERIINMYPPKDECDVEYIGRSIIAKFTCCNKKQCVEMK
ncbi:hypothetical protein [Clostridium culturomicium]|uniref:hypothetical protein n=1 Tax=Clostridium culturomicium TaxID=1499683 RepID=UPI000AFFF7B9|nr:hypothetical protein [Clostridium culturomicium]